MPLDNFKSVLFNDGEGLTFGDLNDAENFHSAKLFDQIVRETAGRARPTAGEDPDRLTLLNASYIYALTGRTAYIVPGAGARQTTVRGGTIFQSLGTPNGDAPTFLAYTMEDAEFTLTHAIGDATNPRLDLIEVKLEYVNDDLTSRIVQDPLPSTLQSSQNINKKRRVQATFQIKQGTPAATPAYPTLTAGYAALAAVYVPATHNAVFVAKTHYHDLRIPLKVKVADVQANEMIIEGSPATTFVATSAEFGYQYVEIPASTAAGNGRVSVVCPIPATGKLLGVGIYKRADHSGGTCSVKLSRQEFVDPANQTSTSFLPITTEIADLSGTSLLSTSTSWNFSYLDAASLETEIGASIGVAPTFPLGPPLWGNGYPCGPCIEPLTASPFLVNQLSRLILNIDITTGAADDVKLFLVRWFYAEGI